MKGRNHRRAFKRMGIASPDPTRTAAVFFLFRAHCFELDELAPRAHRQTRAARDVLIREPVLTIARKGFVVSPSNQSTKLPPGRQFMLTTTRRLTKFIGNY